MPDSVLELIARLEAAESKQIPSASARQFKQMEKRLEALRKKNAALLMAIKAKQSAMEAAWKDGYCLFGTEGFTKAQKQFSTAMNPQPSAELLEQRDRNRDAKLLREAAMACDSIDDGVVSLHDVAASRESGEWIPELGE